MTEAGALRLTPQTTAGVGVELSGKRGEMIAECVDIAFQASITYAFVSDTPGNVENVPGLLLSNFPSARSVQIDTYYTPWSAFAAFMNTIMMRRPMPGGRCRCGAIRRSDQRGQVW